MDLTFLTLKYFWVKVQFQIATLISQILKSIFNLFTIPGYKRSEEIDTFSGPVHLIGYSSNWTVFAHGNFDCIFAL